MAAAAGIAVVGGLMQAYGSIEQGRMSREAATNDARIAMNNARLAKEQAREQEMRYRASTRKTLASITAGYAASGITMEGSPTEVLNESVANAEADALQIRRGGSIRSQEFIDDAGSSSARGRAAQSLGNYGAGAAVLTGASRIARY